MALADADLIGDRQSWEQDEKGFHAVRDVRLLGSPIQEADARSRLKAAMIFLLVYILGSVSVTLSAWANAGVRGALSVPTIALIAFCSGAGLRGSFQYGYQRISGATMGTMVCMAIATWLGQGFRAELFGIELSGSLWGWLGFLAAVAVNPGHSRGFTALKST